MGNQGITRSSQKSSYRAGVTGVPPYFGPNSCGHNKHRIEILNILDFPFSELKDALSGEIAVVVAARQDPNLAVIESFIRTRNNESNGRLVPGNPIQDVLGKAKK
jgi:hypothetical protein